MLTYLTYDNTEQINEINKLNTCVTNKQLEKKIYKKGARYVLFVKSVNSCYEYSFRGCNENILFFKQAHC